MPRFDRRHRIGCSLPTGDPSCHTGDELLQHGSKEPGGHADRESSDEPGDRADRERYEACFKNFLFECFDYPDLDPQFHGTLAEFMESRGRPTPRTRDRYFPNRSDLCNRRAQGGVGITQEQMTKDCPYGVQLDGSFRGILIAYRGDGSYKLVLNPRGHLKSSVITVAYVVWRILKNPAIRVLIANAKAANAWKFLRSQKWQFLHNEKIKRYWPHLHLTIPQILRENITWTRNEYCVPRVVHFESGEATVEGIGVGGNLVSRHYDLIVADDLVNDKNVRSPALMEATMEWFQNMHSLLEPGGDVVVIGTRWDYNDLYSTLIYRDEYNKKFSLFLATATGKDEKPVFPKKFSKDILRGLAESMTPYKFSCQYYNQPVDRENAEFLASWLRWFEHHDEEWKGILHYNFLLVDPAFSEEEGDSTGIVFLSCDYKDDWYVRRPSRELRAGDIPAIIDAIFEIVTQYEVMTVGIETRGFQRAIAHGLYDEMQRRNFYFHVRELKTESNKNKKSRILRLAPRFRAGKIYFEGKSIQLAEGGIKSLTHQYLRYPRGKDDMLDALAYACDVVIAPDPPDGKLFERPPVETHKERLRRLSREKLREIAEMVKTRKPTVLADEHMGPEH